MSNEIDAAIADLEAKVRTAVRAINKAGRQQRKYLELADKAGAKMERTRAQHLEPANRLLADLLTIKAQIEK